MQRKPRTEAQRTRRYIVEQVKKLLPTATRVRVYFSDEDEAESIFLLVCFEDSSKMFDMKIGSDDDNYRFVSRRDATDIISFDFQKPFVARKK